MNPRTLLKNSFTFGLIATLTSCASGVCIGFATRSALLTAACSLAFISLQYSIAAASYWIVVKLSPPPDDEACMDHHLVSMPVPSKQSRHCTATASGYALPQVLGFIVMLGGALLFIPACYLITVVVFGASEPQW